MTYSHGKLAILPTENTGAFSTGGDAAHFRFMFDDVQSNENNRLPETDTATVTEALMALGASLVDSENENEALNMDAAVVYTYLGQFLDHDITLQGAVNETLAARFDIDPANTVPLNAEALGDVLRNGRNPRLNLDSLYGPNNGGAVIPMTADGTKFIIGTTQQSEANGSILPPVPNTDLPRNSDGVPLIGDNRNDENLLVAQMHVAFLKFHNRVVDAIRANPTIAPNVSNTVVSANERLFLQARRLTEWHYQWIILHDYLPNVCMPEVVTEFSQQTQSQAGDDVMSFEFAGAAFRFGHSMVRNVYNYNEHFGASGTTLNAASFELLFRFTGKGKGAVPALPANWVIDWSRFIDKEVQAARGIDTHLAVALGDMQNEVDAGSADSEQIKALLRMLAQRNLLRGYKMSLPTGQAIAHALEESPLTRAALSRDPSTDAILEAAGFFEKTPLWYYVLKEAEVQTSGKTLGRVGSNLVAGTIIGLLRSDSASILNLGASWRPDDGLSVATISDLVLSASQV